VPSASLIIGLWPSCPHAIRATAISLTVRRSYLVDIAQVTPFAHASCAACGSRYPRRSNPRPASSNSLPDNALELHRCSESVPESVGAASPVDSPCPCLSHMDADFRRLAESWSSLPPHIRLAINALLDSWSQAACAVSNATGYDSLDSTPRRRDCNQIAHCGPHILQPPNTSGDLLKSEPIVSS
jgi:hypothetical protein